jgi:putative sporulation protein YtaF
LTTSALLAILLIGIASNLDNAGVGLAYGVRKIRIPFWANFIIALISFLATAISGFFGNYVSKFLPSSIANILGMGVLVIVGVWVLYQPFRKHSNSDGTMLKILQNPEEADWDRSKSIGFWESVVLGIALAMNALAGGFDAGVTGLSILITAMSVGIFSLLLLGIAAHIGEKYIINKLGDYATVVAGVLLILIGIHQLF